MDGQFYWYSMLPMGIHSAHFIFTEVTKPTVRHLRRLGIRVMKYLDDFPSGASKYMEQQFHGKFMVGHLRSLGWLIQVVKLVGIPVPMDEIPAFGIVLSFKNQQLRLRSGTV